MDGSRGMEFVPFSGQGRSFSVVRQVRLGDATPQGRLRLDAVARYLQDIAIDDAQDAGLANSLAWILRRLVFRVDGDLPALGGQVRSTTFCGSLGSHHAERRTTLTGESGRLEASAIWVSVNKGSGRPERLSPQVRSIYEEGTAEGRRSTTKLVHPNPPPSARARDWAVRATDFDVMGHVNNAIFLAAVEEGLVAFGATAPIRRVELELRVPVTEGPALQMLSLSTESELQVWMVGPPGMHASVRVELS